MRRRAFGLIPDQQFEHQLPRRLGPFARGLHLHALCRPPDAGCGKHPLAFDLDHAGAAIAVGPVARFRQPAEMRDLDALPVRHLPDRLARLRLDLGAVQRKPNRISHCKAQPELKIGVPAKAGTHPSTTRQQKNGSRLSPGRRLRR